MFVRLLPLALTAALAVGLAACGDDDEPVTAPATAATTTSTGAPAAATDASFNDADIQFAQEMIAHHRQAIEMADLALDPATGASGGVQDLAARIKEAQSPEIELMTGWLTAWDEPVEMDTAGGHDMGSMDDSMMTAEDMDALAAASGGEFDAMWLQMMIRHHEGAITMAETVKTEGANPDVLVLADQIIVTQRAEIDEMKAATTT